MTKTQKLLYYVRKHYKEESNMAYSTDGSSHHSGIKTEKHLREYLQAGAAKILYPDLSDSFKVIKRGGTKYKQDLEIVDNERIILLSVKKKENSESGSFDWVNTTKAFTGIKPLEKFAKSVKTISRNEKRYGQAKIDRLQASYDCLNELSSSDLTSILKQQVMEKNKDMHIMIRDLYLDSVWKFKFSDLPLYNSIENHTPYLESGNGVESSSILFKTEDGSILDHKIRIRVVDNNGITALIGKSKSNPSSIACIKIQQDNVGTLIKSLENKITKF